MRAEAALPALTHHEILRLVEPFVRAGHRPDLAASDRTRRRIVFHPQAVAAEQGQLAPLRRKGAGDRCAPASGADRR